MTKVRLASEGAVLERDEQGLVVLETQDGWRYLVVDGPTPSQDELLPEEFQGVLGIEDAAREIEADPTDVRVRLGWAA